MDPALRLRLDLIIGLLAFIAVSAFSLLLLLGGYEVLLYLGTFGLLLGLLLQSVGVGPFGERERQH
ncbi:hypothetical protein [Halovenus salina]|uniref:Major facilitator superfamily (MFS) profile domain-containing protein n=1 Tax=Halovenus salina TaxID=1510225 RepID=A0ABD5W0G9_9EURY|nr:hypothetical protein [Halovenus salina]